MVSTTYKLRIDLERLARWQKSAEEGGLKLAEWIRRRCDGDPDKVVRTDGDVHVVQGGTPAPERPKVRKSEFAEAVAGRTKHEPGCQCFQCVQAERFFRSQREK